MIRSFAAAVALAVTAQAAPADDASVRAVADAYEAIDRAANPFASGLEGDRAALSRLPDVTPQAQDARRRALEPLAARLAGVPDARLSAAARLDKQLLARLIDTELGRIRFDEARLPFTSEGGFYNMLSQRARTTPIGGRADAEAWIARLEAYPAYIATSIANARRGVATGFMQARVTTEHTLRLARAQTAGPVESDALLLPLARLPASIPAADQAALRARARTVVAERIRPAQAEAIRFIERDYLPKAPARIGARSMPGGADYYPWLVRRYTTTTMTPDEVHALGAKEVARIRAAMDAAMAETGFKGDFAAFLAFLRSDPRFYATSREDLLEKASEISKRIDDQLPRYFGTLPRLPYGVRPVPRDIEDNYTTGRYNRGSPQLGIAGGYMVNTGKLDQRPLYELPALTLHEAVPGHHLQNALTQELGDLPWFRRHSSLNAYGEGWGLYSESLGEDMGIYRDAYERFGKLSYEMWRACRLVADTGMHWKGWSIEQARACFRDNSALAPHNIETELQRYVGWPGQALAYKVGELRIQAARARAEAKLGDRFDLRAFHDAVLLAGPLPLDLLDQRIDEWIASRKG